LYGDCFQLSATRWQAIRLRSTTARQVRFP
jgi:hypothetical protein